MSEVPEPAKPNENLANQPHLSDHSHPHPHPHLMEDQDDVFVNTAKACESREIWTPSADKVEQSASESVSRQCSSLTSDDTSLQLSITPSTPSECKFNYSPSAEPSRPESRSLQDALKSEEDFMDYVLSLPTQSMSKGVTISEETIDALTTVEGLTRTTTNAGNKVGLDHLDNLCKLMEQLGHLREANSKLQRKVHYLEDMKSLHEMHQEIIDSQSLDLPPLPPVAPSEPTLLPPSGNNGSRKMRYSPEVRARLVSGSDSAATVIKGSTRMGGSAKERRYAVHKSRSQVTVSGGSLLKRERSKSVGHDEIVALREAEAKLGNANRSKSKRFPKWSKVKEALGWDKPSSSQELQTSAEGSFKQTKARSSSKERPGVGSTSDPKKVRKGSARALKSSIPMYMTSEFGFEFSDTEEMDRSETGSFVGHVSTDEGVEDGQIKRCSLGPDSEKGMLDISEARRRRSSPGGNTLKSDQRESHETDPGTGDESLKMSGQGKGRESRGPWNRVKTMIQTRKDSIKKKSKKSLGPDKDRMARNGAAIEADPVSAVSLELSVASDEGATELSATFPETKSFTEISGKPFSSTRSIRRASVTEASVKQLSSDKSPMASDQVCPFSVESHSLTQAHPQSHLKKKPKIVPLDLRPTSRTGTDHKTDTFVPTFIRSKSRTICESQSSSRISSMSPPVSRRSKWNKMKKVFANAGEGVVKPDLAMEGEIVSKSVPASPASVSETSFTYELELEKLQSSNEDKLEEDDKVGSESHSPFTAPSQAAPVANIVQELQRNLSDDFNRKMLEWDKIRSSGLSASLKQQPTSPKPERKNSVSKVSKKRKPERQVADKTNRQKVKDLKDLNWLEKELQKIEREKQRLAKERQKFEERALRLERLKETVLKSEKSNKKEVLVRTSAGEFRFEGISDDFTKKLYEWETKTGVCPELSTIALLDSSANSNQAKQSGLPSALQRSSSSETKTKTLQRGISKSESSIFEAMGGQTSQKTSSASLPSLKQLDVSRADVTFLQLSQLSQSYQPQGSSKANSEPDIKAVTLKDDILVKSRTHSGELVALLEANQGHGQEEEEALSAEKKCEESLHLTPEDNYYNLLEENMYLLEQLKTKEEICRRLETELVTLDDRMEEMNSKHQEEMEHYREKLWEVHMAAGSKPRDFEDSLKLIAELKDRIEELQHCTERLKCDKETLEDSFRYHSEQQAKLTVELIEKMKDLQQMSISGFSSAKDEGRRTRRRKAVMKCDAENVTKLHDLSTRLLQQARGLEHALVERTRQICRLRWELLNRDVSAMRLQTELQKAKWQASSRATHSVDAASKRSQYGQRRSWSSSEKLFMKLNPKDETLQEALQDRLKRLSNIPYSDWPKIDCETNDLSATVQQLKVELLKLGAHAEQRTESEEATSENEPVDQPPEQHPEPAKYSGLLTSPLIAELLPDYEGYFVSEASGQRNNSNRITVRRNSADNISSLSGPEGSESSSLNDGERVSYVLRLPRNRWRRSRDNVSTSSESSYIEEESFTAVQWCRPRTSSDFGSEKDAALSQEETAPVSGELVLQYPNGKKGALRASTSRSSSEVTDQRTDSWGEFYRHRSLFNQFSETSSSAFNEGIEESSSASGHRMPFLDTPDSTQSNLRSSSSSGHDRYAGFPMIDEDSPSWKTRIEQEPIPEGTALTQEERRHSDPCRKFKFNVRPFKPFGAIGGVVGEVSQKQEDETPSPVSYTIHLPKMSDCSLPENTIEEENTMTIEATNRATREAGPTQISPHFYTKSLAEGVRPASPIIKSRSPRRLKRDGYHSQVDVKPGEDEEAEEEEEESSQIEGYEVRTASEHYPKVTETPTKSSLKGLLMRYQRNLTEEDEEETAEEEEVAEEGEGEGEETERMQVERQEAKGAEREGEVNRFVKQGMHSKERESKLKTESGLRKESEDEKSTLRDDEEPDAREDPEEVEEVVAASQSIAPKVSLGAESSAFLSSQSLTSLNSMRSDGTPDKSRLSVSSEVSQTSHGYATESKLEKSGSKGSIASRVTSFIKSRRNSKSCTRSELSAVGALCKQSLMLGVEATAGTVESNTQTFPGKETIRSCPASPGLRAKQSDEDVVKSPSALFALFKPK